MEQLNAKIFYSPVKDPKEIKEIPIEDDKDLEIVDNSVKDIVDGIECKNNIDERKVIDFMGKGLEVNHEDVKEFFEFISEHLYGPAREPQKYLVLITTNKYSFIYHLELEEAISFEKKSIRKFMKYLDSSNLLRFIYRSSDGHFRIYDKYNTKGWKRLLGLEPEYEAKGNVKVRIKRSEKTDIVVETYIDDLENIKGTIEFRWEDKKASIKKISDAKITKVIINGENVDPKAVSKKIKYEKLDIGKFITEYNNYQVENGEIRESKEQVHVNDKSIKKPEEELNGMEVTYFVLGSRVESEDLVKEMKNEMKNLPNVGFVELNRFNNSYNTVRIGDSEVFGKIRSYEEVKELLDLFNETIISELKKEEKEDLAELIRDVGLLSLCEYLESEGFKLKIQKAVKEKLKEDLKRNKGIEEIDELGIELKSGKFFGKSVANFSKKLTRLLPKGENKIRICLIGVNEDEKRLDPILLSRMRNEDLKKLKEEADEDIKIPLIDVVPVNEKEGVLIIVLYNKKEKNVLPPSFQTSG